MKKIIDFDIRKVQRRIDTGAVWVQLPSNIFAKGDLVMIAPFDTDTVTITKRVPSKKR
jgi:hypothetical protein